VEFARIPTPKIKKHDLILIVKELMFSQKVATKNIDYKLLPSSSKKCYVSCDSMQISQVLLNILKNAAESIEQSSENLKDFKGLVTITIAEKGDDFAEIRIVDNGAGMSADVLEKIFEPYVTTKTKGTGLGLAIVKKIIEDHGGVIAIKPLEVGVEVKFTLPLYRSEK
jgi:two-component system nitrogen regulation sensor histidine kinase NtrY